MQLGDLDVLCPSNRANQNSDFCAIFSLSTLVAIFSKCSPVISVTLHGGCGDGGDGNGGDSGCCCGGGFGGGGGGRVLVVQ